jgi:hypothetical protein
MTLQNGSHAITKDPIVGMDCGGKYQADSNRH